MKETAVTEWDHNEQIYNAKTYNEAMEHRKTKEKIAEEPRKGKDLAFG